MSKKTITIDIGGMEEYNNTSAGEPTIRIEDTAHGERRCTFSEDTNFEAHRKVRRSTGKNDSPLKRYTILSRMERDRRLSLVIQETYERKTLPQILKAWIAPSDTTTNAKIFGGRRAVQEEQIRSRDAGWIIHPYSSLRYISLSEISL